MTPAGRLTLLPLVGAAMVACGDARPGAPATAESLRGSSAVAPCPVLREPLETSDGTHVYIEPENAITVGSRVLVAGIPSYTWKTGSASNAIMATRDEYLAALFDASDVGSDVALIEKPVDVRVGDVRVADLGGGRWAALFAENGPDSLLMSERLRAVWYAEHDGEGWARVERLPPPPVGSLDFSSSSALVRFGTHVAWVVAARRGGTGATSLRYYERSRGAWSSEEVFDVWAETTALAYDPSGVLWLALVSDDPEIPGWQQSLRLYARAGGWRLASRAWIADEGTRIRDVEITSLSGGITASWRSVSRDGSTGLARVGIGLDSDGTLLRVDESAQALVPLSPIDGVPAWVVHHVDPITQLGELRLVGAVGGAVGGAVSTLHSVPNPYLGFFAALSTRRGEALVVGPEFDPSPARPTVRSLILRLSTSCT